MPLIIRDSKLLLGSDGKLTTNDECCCGDPPTCCETSQITSISFLSASSGPDCCWGIIGTYLPDSGSSGGCEYNFSETFPEPDNPCVDLDTDPPTDPPADLCFTKTSGSNVYRFFLRSIDIEARLENGDFVGDAKIDVQITITFFCYKFTPGSPGCTGSISSQTGGVIGEALDDCGTVTVDFVNILVDSDSSDSNTIHPACETSVTDITVQIVVEPL